MRKLVASEENIGVPVQLPDYHTQKKKKTHKSQSEIRDLIKLKNQRLIKICIHAKNVADGVVFSLDCKRRRVDYLRVPLIRDPVIFEQKRSEG